MSKLRKNSDQNSLSVFDVLASNHVPLAKREPEMKQPRQKKVADRSWEEESAAPKLRHNNIEDVYSARTGSSIRSARCAPDGISENGGPSNGFGVANRNSIFDSEVLNRLAENETAKEKTAAEKSNSYEMRKQKQEEWAASMQPKIGESDEDFMARKAASVSVSRSGSDISNKRQWVKQNSISMFDNGDFERFRAPEGESIQPRQKESDHSWRVAKRASKIQDIESESIERLSSAGQESSYKNMHKSATDRLFDIIQKNSNQKD